MSVRRENARATTAGWLERATPLRRPRTAKHPAGSRRPTPRRTIRETRRACRRLRALRRRGRGCAALLSLPLGRGRHVRPGPTPGHSLGWNREPDVERRPLAHDRLDVDGCPEHLLRSLTNHGESRARARAELLCREARLEDALHMLDHDPYAVVLHRQAQA